MITSGAREVEYVSQPRQGQRFKAVIEYDGTGFVGFQVQRIGRTVQGELERVLQQVTQQQTRVVGAARTDSGVHASGQVVHFDVAWPHPVADLQRACNALLDDDVVLLTLELAKPGFHARYSACSRQYVYSIDNRYVRSPLRDRYAAYERRPLDVPAMDRASAYLIGRHDFYAFGWPPRGDNTVRTVYRAGCRREGDMVYVDIEANAFLRKMVRRIVGNLILVGTHDMSHEEFVGLLELKHRRIPGAPAPAQGLDLVKVNY